jgi:superoxide reductase
MKTLLCQLCGHIEFNEAPDNCFVCGAPKEKFKENPNAIKKPGDPGNKHDMEQKHIPSVNVVKKSGPIGESCTDIYVKIGEIAHSMEEKHFIQYIDFYLDNKFIARNRLSPIMLNSNSCRHLKVNKGKIVVVQNCNLHGNWMKEISL